MNMNSKIEVETIESLLTTDADGDVDIEEMGDDVNLYYEVTDSQSIRYTSDAILIGREPVGFDHRGKLMLYEFGEDTVLVIDGPRERRDILITGADILLELETIAAKMIEAEIASDEVPISIKVTGDRGEAVGDWAEKTYADDVTIA
jgi:hypothetical protein